MGEVKQEVTRRVERFFNSRIDIIIPFHGQYDLVRVAVESILRFTMSNVFRIFLVDDSSTNSDFVDSFSKIPQITTLRTPQQLGFGGAMEFGFKASQKVQEDLKQASKPLHPYVVFMNSDCRVEDVNWLKALGMGLLEMKQEGVRMVSPRTNNPVNGDPLQKGSREFPSKNVIVTEGYLSMYCFMCHRDLFKHVGGFVKNYPFGFYEDEEFAYRMNKYGYKQAVVGSSWIHHEGEMTIKELWRKRPGMRETMEGNRDKCIQDMRSLNG